MQAFGRFRCTYRSGFELRTGYFYCLQAQKGDFHILAKRVASAGILVALALIFSYVEVLVPIHLGIPGVKLGLANLVTVTGLYLLPLPDVWMISMIRIGISGLLFGNFMSLLYSFSGGILSLLVMLLLKKSGRFSVIGVSSAGGVFHNVGQILAAMAVTSVPVVAYYLPVLMGVGLLTGFLLGLLSSRILRIFRRI